MTQPQAVKLTLHVGNVVLGIRPGMLPCLACMLFRWQPKSVISHRVKDVVANHSLVARKNIRADVTERMTDVQP